MNNRVAIPVVKSGLNIPLVWQMTDSYEDFIKRCEKVFNGEEFWVFESMDHYIPGYQRAG